MGNRDNHRSCTQMVDAQDLGVTVFVNSVEVARTWATNVQIADYDQEPQFQIFTSATLGKSGGSSSEFGFASD